MVQGPKWCGKTTTCEQIANSVLYMAKPEDEKQNLLLVDINSTLLLKGDTPRLIDEWQMAPKLWDAIRFEVDHRNEEGQSLLTGSAVPASTENIVHTGTGRFAWVLMRPMSLYESKESIGNVSLKELFTTPKQISGICDMDINRLAFLVCRGGWPRATFMEDEIALEQAYDYYDAIVNTDISRVDGLMKSYARNQGQQVSTEVLKQDMIINDSKGLDNDTVLSYTNALKKIFVIEDTPAWNPNLRSKTAIRTSDTRYFIDSSIAIAALGIGPNDLVNDLNTFGFLFETLCIRDLRVYSSMFNGNVYHYRDSNGLECDAVIHLRNGDYGLVEIKLGGDKLIEEGTKNLIKLSKKIDTTKMKKPSFLLVLIGVGRYAYVKKNGVYVVPIGCLKD